MDGRDLESSDGLHKDQRRWVHRLKKIKLHSTRHSHASHLLASNVHPKIVQERLGHSSIAITMDIYSHAMPNMQQDAVERVDDALRSALQKRAKKEIG